MKRALIILAYVFALVGCVKSEIAQTVDENREWIENVPGVEKVTNNKNEIVVVAEKSKARQVKKLLPEVLNDYKIIVIEGEPI